MTSVSHSSPAQSWGQHSPCWVLDWGRQPHGSLHSPQDPWLRLQNLSVDNVRNLLGQNVGDLQKARSHPNVILWMHSHNMSDLSEMGLDTSPTLAYGISRPPANTTYPPSDLIHTLNLPGNDGVAPTSGMVHTPCAHP